MIDETRDPERIRSYELAGEANSVATICQAAMATSAATSYFAPVKIGPCHYIDGALSNNNPILEVETEAQNIWRSDQGELKPLVKCVLSIGTGLPARRGMTSSALTATKLLTSLLTNTVLSNKNFQDRWQKHAKENRVFRFDVDRGLDQVDLDAWDAQGTMVGATTGYLADPIQQSSLRSCAENLAGKLCTEWSLPMYTYSGKLISSLVQGTPLDFHKTIMVEHSA